MRSKKPTQQRLREDNTNMSPSENPSKQLYLLTPTIPSGSSTTANSILRLTTSLVVTAFVFCAFIAPQVLAETGPQSNSQASSNIDPDAMKALNKMGAYLRTLKAFQVDSEVTNDDVLDDGQIITDTKTNTLLAVSPNFLRAELKSDDRDVFLFYDGKSFTVYGKVENYYATVPAPATTAQLVDKVNDDYGIEIPLVDLFKWGTDNSTISKITSAFDVGPSTVQGITCEHYAFRQEGIDWQIWIQLGDYPLPRKFVIRTLTDDARPQHTSNLVWNLAPSYNEAAFAFDPPAGALRITLKGINGNGTKSNQ
ncbi:MAG TPA: DUF2092 domain-containing protein [Terriglobales bacterium]